MKNEKGFTLVEMLVVLLIISILILVTIPNVSKHFASIDEKGCNAYILMLQGQVEAYKLNKNEYPASVSDLIDEGYIVEKDLKCPDNTEIKIVDGKVIGPGNSKT
ncbi:competence type IV pilus major pilin ComGC [Solibacillus isronensis]|uniref:competence type IV pilus major pilin ComGC n=1 Tax=Solibacillus isronensis TaxID=412383 RepID=UPI00203F7855|nr:competence type IV pilus major pilin ComGC [Solibacillus isronensis]MCM3720850.1 prepilin-type N-terminal cleavage/methylation domain-containing protein [Solibacillus isronensis]